MPGQAAAQDLQGRVTLDLHDVPIDTALRGLFSQTNTKYSVEPGIRGTVTISIENVPPEVALRAILSQVGGSYRIDRGVYTIVKNGPAGFGSDSTEIVLMEAVPYFRPGEYSASYEVRNKGLYLSPHRTMGGTYGLLAEAAADAGFQDWSVFRYGDNGFAIVLPCEAVDENGIPDSSARFGSGLSTSWGDYRRISETWSQAGLHAKSSYRVLVLLVTADRIQPDGFTGKSDLSRPYGSAGFPDSLRNRKWTADPKLTVLVYEFRGRPSTLLKPGQSSTSAKAQIVDSGLWTARQLR